MVAVEVELGVEATASFGVHIADCADMEGAEKSRRLILAALVAASGEACREPCREVKASSLTPRSLIYFLQVHCPFQ